MFRLKRELDQNIKVISTDVVVTIEENQDDTTCRGQEHQPVFCEDIRVKQATSVADSDFVLVLLYVTIKRCKVDIRRRLINVNVCVRCLEDTGVCLSKHSI